MASRTKKINELAQLVHNSCSDSEDLENNANLAIISHCNEAYFVETNSHTVNKILSPEELTNIIESAEIMFQDDPRVLDGTSCHVSCNQQANTEEFVNSDREQANDNDYACDENSVEDSSSYKNQEGDQTNIVNTLSVSRNASHLEESINLEIEQGEEKKQEGSKKRKKVKGHNKRVINKKLRMAGKNYLGFRKPSNQKNTFHDAGREERKLKDRCACKKKSKDSTRKCYQISDEDRKIIFTKFWSDMTWEQRKVYVGNTVKVCDKNRPKTLNKEETRRVQTFKYFLKVGNETLPVCKKMYLHTLSLGEWSARSWALKSEHGMTNSDEKSLSLRERRQDNFNEGRTFLSNFFDKLNKLPSHY